MISNDKKPTFDESLNKNNVIHHENIQKLGIETFKVVKSENPAIPN